MDELSRFFALETRLLERVSTTIVAFPFGVAYLDEDCPDRYYSSFLRVGVGADRVTAEELVGSAERILGGGPFTHRMIIVNDDRLGSALAPAFDLLGYRASSSIVMAHRRGPDRAGEVQVDEVPFAEVRSVIRESYLEDPALPDEIADPFADQQGRKERTIGARFFVGTIEGHAAGTCELYLDGEDAQVENVGTLERFRGRGVARSVVLRAVDEARASGASEVFIVADEDDWPKLLYERLGFHRIGRTREFLRVPGEHPAVSDDPSHASSS